MDDSDEDDEDMEEVDEDDEDVPLPRIPILMSPISLIFQFAIFDVANMDRLSKRTVGVRKRRRANGVRYAGDRSLEYSLPTHPRQENRFCKGSRSSRR